MAAFGYTEQATKDLNIALGSFTLNSLNLSSSSCESHSGYQQCIMSIEGGQLLMQRPKSKDNVAGKVTAGSLSARYFWDAKGVLSQVLVAPDGMKLTLTVSQSHLSYAGGDANFTADTSVNVVNSSPLVIKRATITGKLTLSAPFEVKNAIIRLNGIAFHTGLASTSPSTLQIDLSSFKLACNNCSLMFKEDLLNTSSTAISTTFGGITVGASISKPLIINNNSISANEFKVSGQINVTNVSSQIHLDQLSTHNPALTLIKLPPDITKPIAINATDRIELRELTGTSLMSAKEIRIEKLKAEEIAIFPNPSKVRQEMQSPRPKTEDVLIGTGLSDQRYIRLSTLREFHKTLANAEDNPTLGYKITLSANNGLVDLKETKQIQRDPNADDSRIPAVMVEVVSWIMAKATLYPYEPLIRRIVAIPAGEAVLLANLRAATYLGLEFGGPAAWAVGAVAYLAPTAAVMMPVKQMYKSMLMLINPYLVPPTGKYYDLQATLYRRFSEVTQPTFLFADLNHNMSDQEYFSLIDESINEVISHDRPAVADPNVQAFSKTVLETGELLRQQRKEIQVRSESWEKFRTTREQFWTNQTKAVETQRSKYQIQLNSRNGVISQAMRDKKDAVFNAGQKNLQNSMSNFEWQGFASDPNPDLDDPNCIRIYDKCYQGSWELHVPTQTQP